MPLNYEILPTPSIKMKLYQAEGLTHPFFHQGVLTLPHGFRKGWGKIHCTVKMLSASPRVIVVLLCGQDKEYQVEVMRHKYFFHKTHRGWIPIYDKGRNPVLERAFEIARAFAALGND